MATPVQNGVAKASGGDLKSPTARKILNVPKDLTVTFDDGQIVEAHALILVLASPVFRDLLTDDHGNLLAELSLPGKRAEEFALFQQALLPASLRFASLTDEETFFTLCRWAHEYEVDALRTLCEDHLIQSVPVTESSLEHALAFKLDRRRAQCIDEMKRDLPRFVGPLKQLATSATVGELEELWPLLCAAAFIEPYDMPPAEQVCAMWPFIEAAIHKPAPSTLLQAELKKAVADTMSSAVADLNEHASYWSAAMYDRFWESTAHAKTRLKDMGMPLA